MLTNILSSVEDLKTTSVKIEDTQELNNAERAERFENFKVLTITWGTIVTSIVFFITLICCCCCSVHFVENVFLCMRQVDTKGGYKSHQ